MYSIKTLSYSISYHNFLFPSYETERYALHWGNVLFHIAAAHGRYGVPGVKPEHTFRISGRTGTPRSTACSEDRLHLFRRFLGAVCSDDGQAAPADVDTDEVSLLHKCDRPAVRSLRADVADDRPL